MKIFSAKLWRRLLVVMATLLAIFITVMNIAYDYSAALNSAFNIVPYRVEKVEGNENVDTEYFKRQYTTQETLKAYTEEVCRNIEAEGIVLLRNDETDGKAALPLAKGSKVSLFGQGSVNFNYSSTGSSSTSSTSAYANLKTALSDLDVNPTLWDFYATGAASSYRRGKPNLVYRVNEAPWKIYTDAVKNSFATYGDAAIFVMTRDGGEGQDLSTVGSDGIDGSYLSITAQEKEVLQQLTVLKSSGLFKSIILILNSASQIQLDFMFDETIDIDACLWTGYVGSTGIYAINDVLVGNVTPSGRLSDTYAKDNFSSPAMASWALNPNKSFSQTYSNASNYSEFNNTQNVYAVYVEGIYVGYRYYETRYADTVTGSGNAGEYDYDADVAFPFGYGLSYTEFMYDRFEMTEDEDTVTISVEITNIGGVAGKEVVQVYMQKPYIEGGIEKSAIELVGFGKTELLESGDYETVTVEIDKSVMKSYDAENTKGYVVDAGDYYFAIGSDSHNALNNILQKQGYDVGGDATFVDSIKVAETDTETYAYSDINTDVKVTNQFDFADINRYEGRGDNGVTYVSRSDWEGTFPKKAESLYITEQMAKDIRSYKPLEEDGSEMPEYGKQNGLSLIMLRSTEEEEIAYDDPRWDSLLDQLTYEEQAYLITNGQHNTVLIKSINKPATMDENGPNGVSGSTTNTSFPSEGIWASTFNLELIEEMGKCLAEDALAAGITGLYAGGVNMHRTPFGGRAHEYFSEDPYLSAVASVAEVKGMQSKGVIAYVKHLAVNDEETNRNGIAIWLNEQAMREIYLLPFEYSFKPTMGNAHATMTSFNRIGNIWTSASSELMENVLRDEWGFDGFAITDMASSNAQTFMTFVDGIANGTNLYDGPGSTDALDEYKGSAMFANKMRESTHRILYVIANYSAAMNGIAPGDKILPIMTWWEITVVSIVVVFAVFTAASLAMYVVSVIKGKKHK